MMKLLKSKLFLAGVFLIIVAAVIAVAPNFQNSPEKIAADFCTAFNDHNIEKMSKLLLPSNFENLYQEISISAAELEFLPSSQTLLFSSFTPDSPISETDDSYETGRAAIFLTDVYGEPGSRISISYLNLQKENGKWYIASL